MAHIITKKELAPSEIDDFVIKQLSCKIAGVSVKFETKTIRNNLLRDFQNNVEISSEEIMDSISRIRDSGGFEIRLTDIKIITASRINMGSRTSRCGLDIACNIELIVKKPNPPIR